MMLFRSASRLAHTHPGTVLVFLSIASFLGLLVVRSGDFQPTRHSPDPIAPPLRLRPPSLAAWSEGATPEGTVLVTEELEGGGVSNGRVPPPEAEGPEVPPSEADQSGEGVGQKTVVHLAHSDHWLVKPVRDPSERFLAYLPHSGISNQRISLVNALTLSKLLSRTLIVPPLTLGSGVDWHLPPRLQEDLDFVETLNAKECEAMHWEIRKEKCGKAWRSKQASWSWLLDPSAISAAFRVVSRPTHRRSWYLEGLGVRNEEVKTFPDTDRRTYRFFDTTNTSVPLQEPGATYEYESRLDVEELRALDNYAILEFGSLFGATRIHLDLEENQSIRTRAEALMAFNQPVLERASAALAERLGGVSAYVGVHLRVGGAETSPKFHDGAQVRVAGIFRALCRAVGLSRKASDVLLRKNLPSETNPDLVPETLSLAPQDSAFRPSPHLRCPYELYPANSPLAPLNTPVYVSTDSKEPRIDKLVEVFRNTFPCLFFFNDFHLPPKSKAALHFRQTPVPELDHVMDEIVDEHGDSLASFLSPFVEAEVIAKGRTVIGTPGSTFSSFAQTVLFDAYHPPNQQ